MKRANICCVLYFHSAYHEVHSLSLMWPQPFGQDCRYICRLITIHLWWSRYEISNCFFDAILVWTGHHGPNKAGKMNVNSMQNNSNNSKTSLTAWVAIPWPRPPQQDSSKPSAARTVSLAPCPPLLTHFHSHHYPSLLLC